MYTIDVVVAVGHDGRCCLLDILPVKGLVPEIWVKMVVESLKQNIDDAYSAWGVLWAKTPPGIYKTSIMADITEEDQEEWFDRDICEGSFYPVDIAWSDCIKLPNPWETGQG